MREHATYLNDYISKQTIISAVWPIVVPNIQASRLGVRTVT